jgi:hypothetical protein
MRNDVPGNVIQKLFIKGLEEQILDIMLASIESNKEVSSIPISPSILTTGENTLFLRENVYEAYTKIVERINNSQTAQEIPFLLLGKKIPYEKESLLSNRESFIEIQDIVFLNQGDLSDTSAHIDVKKFEEYLNNPNYDVISIGHTHGNVSEDIKASLLVSTLPDDIKSRYDIREAGLNISIADFWQYESFLMLTSKLQSHKDILQTIIMYNGDMVVLDDNFSRCSVNTILSNGKRKRLSNGYTR